MILNQVRCIPSYGHACRTFVTYLRTYVPFYEPVGDDVQSGILEAFDVRIKTEGHITVARHIVQLDIFCGLYPGLDKVM